ncbi:cytochrome P450 2C23-like [Ruditapes philippinarum]|uniref:cytochrome P450 2C23-like n=1 Tax=Ruditapes philippinarum TaxID=129788 RepID=UPI00295C2097|nr:cytochrome P450 2C23-like [Ruditapes philippinarum]
MDSALFKETDYSILTTASVFLVTFFLVYINTRRQKGVPPGPALFPIVGNLPSLATRDILGRLNELRKQYGDVFGLYTGSKLFVFLNGYDVIHDALIKKGSKFMFRALPSFDQEEDQHTKGLIFSKGRIWKEGRMFAISTLQEICFKDKGFLEHLVEFEVNDLTETILKSDHPFDIERVLNSSLQNVIFQVVYGYRFDLNDDGLHWFQKTVRAQSKRFLAREVILNCLPFLEHVPGDILGIERSRVDYAAEMHFLSKRIEKFENQKKGTQRKTFVECYLEKMAANKSNETDSTFDEKDMKIAAHHLITAGSETSASVIRWILLYLIRNPHIQDKLCAEMTNVLGNEALSIGDRKRMPYMQAVILEGLRISHVVPLSLPHTVEQDTLFRGYVIPENCTIIPVLSTALKDPDVWEDPEEFKPERFLNATGNDVIIPKQFVPFSLGPRSCLGETLATIEIFLFLAGLVQKLKFLPEHDNEYPDQKGELGLTFTPLNFKMRVEKR